MFKKLFSSKKEVAVNSKLETLSKNELKNVLGGGSSATVSAITPAPISDPIDNKHGQVNSADFGGK